MTDHPAQPGPAPRGEPRRGTLSCNTGGLPLSVEVLDSRMRLKERTRGRSTPVELDEGDYVIVAHLPTGGTVDRRVSLRAGDALEVDLTTPNPEFPPEPALRPSPGGETTDQGITEASLPPARPTRRAGAAMSWELRCLTLGVLQPPGAVRPPRLSIDSFSDDTAQIRVTPAEPAVCFAQIRLPEGAPVTLALPVAPPGATCRLLVSTAGGKLRVTVRLDRELAEAAAAYLGSGQVRSASELMNSEMANDLLFSKMDDPVGGILGAQILLRLDDRPRSRPEEGEAWIGNLAMQFPWLPDAQVLLAEVHARRQEHDQALEGFLRAVDLGLPIFTDSFSMLLSGLERYAEAPDKWGVTKELCERAAAASSALEPIGSSLDFSTIYLTFFGEGPLEAVFTASPWSSVQPDRIGPVTLEAAPAPEVLAPRV